MVVRHWASQVAVSLLLAVTIFGQQQSQSAKPSAQQQQSGQQNKTSTQDLPSAPMPQPTAGQKSEDNQRPSAVPPRPTPPPSEPGPYGPTGPATTSEPPRTAPPPDAPGSSTSKDDKIDITPPANDAKEHPDAGFGSPDIGEFHPFDPHRAAKDVEVGDFYFKRHNYEAAISRYRSALLYKPNDAIATFSLAEALEKAGDVHEAVKNYQAYLKILPNGPKAKEAHKALERLQSKAPAVNRPAKTAAASKPKS